MSLKIGIDVGSTTVKVVVLDQHDNLLFRSYERHFSMVREKTCELLRRAEDILKGKQVKAVITGSAGLGLAKSAKVDFVQEVFATAEAVISGLVDFIIFKIYNRDVDLYGGKAVKKYFCRFLEKYV